jgi:type I restriction enzyme S subunit
MMLSQKPAINSRWPTVPLKRIFRIVNGSTPAPDGENWNGGICWATPEDLGQLQCRIIQSTRRRLTDKGYASCGTSLMPPNSIVLSTRAPIGLIAMTGVPICTNQGCKGLIPIGNDSPHFFYYVLLAAKSILQSLGQGTTFQELGNHELSSLLVPLPPLERQLELGEFLDREVTAIDELIAAKRRLGEVLLEQRSAVISELVAPLSDAATNLYRTRLKRVLKGKLANGIFKKKDQYGSGTKLVNVFDVYREDFIVDLKDLESVEVDYPEVQSFSLSTGDIVLVRSSLKREGIARAAIVPSISEPLVFECHLVKAVPDPAIVLPEYLVYLLNARPFMEQLISLAHTTTMTTIDQSRIGNLEVFLPSLSIQRDLAGKIRNLIVETQKTLEMVEQGIHLLREYRSSLIAATVIDSVDVRNYLVKEAATVCQ